MLYAQDRIGHLEETHVMRAAVGAALMITLSLAGCGGNSGGTLPDITIGPQVGTTPGAAATSSSPELAPPPGPGTPVPGGASNIGIYRGQYFNAWLPKNWTVVNESANGIDIATPRQDGSVGFGYVSGYPGTNDPQTYRNTWAQGSGWTNVSITKQVDLGTLTDLFGTQWSFLATEYDRAYQGLRLHGRMTVAVGNTQYNSYGAMVSTVEAAADRYSQLVGALSAVERTVTLVKGQPTSRNPTTSQDSGYWSQDQTNDRVYQQWQDETLGVVNVHSDETGKDFQAPLDYYWQTGPLGPGYYRRRVEGDYELLTPNDP
jgi:hypothetical protein